MMLGDNVPSFFFPLYNRPAGVCDAKEDYYYTGQGSEKKKMKSSRTVEYCTVPGNFKCSLHMIDSYNDCLNASRVLTPDQRREM